MFRPAVRGGCRAIWSACSTKTLARRACFTITGRGGTTGQHQAASSTSIEKSTFQGYIYASDVNCAFSFRCSRSPAWSSCDWLMCGYHL